MEKEKWDNNNASRTKEKFNWFFEIIINILLHDLPCNNDAIILSMTIY